MNEYAVIETGGKQYVVSAGTVLEIERLSEKEGESLIFDKILLHVVDGSVKLGMPYLDGVTVSAKLIENKKGEKIHVAKFRAKSRHRRVMGHRQHLSRVQIEKIAGKPESKPVREKTAPKSASKTK